MNNGSPGNKESRVCPTLLLVTVTDEIAQSKEWGSLIDAIQTDFKEEALNLYRIFPESQLFSAKRLNGVVTSLLRARGRPQWQLVLHYILIALTLFWR